MLDDVEADTPPLWVKARVAWARPGEDNAHAAGVRFEVITDEQRAWLRQVLREIGGPSRLTDREPHAAQAGASDHARATRAPSSAALTMPPA